MPYITNAERAEYCDGLDQLHPMTPGHLNYVITKLCQDYLGDPSCAATSRRIGSRSTRPRATTTRARASRINEVVGVLECVKQEFYRRVVVPYEDKKIAQNGDVY